ncbi:MAG: TetR/AcrR family transcriptional regulator [Panacagrimonas sp.]
MSLREKQMAQRRARILSSAEKLIRKTGGTDFTMTALAHEAEVSPATPFNLFGSKEGLLYELLLQSLNAFFTRAQAQQSDEPLERVVLAAQAAADVFIDNPKRLRPLYRFLLGVIDPTSRPEFLRRSHGYWRISLDAAVSAGWMDEQEADAVASGLLVHILGVLDLWVHRDISDTELSAHLLQGVLLHLCPFVRAKQLPDLRARLRQTALTLARTRAPV